MRFRPPAPRRLEQVGVVLFGAGLFLAASCRTRIAHGGALPRPPDAAWRAGEAASHASEAAPRASDAASRLASAATHPPYPADTVQVAAPRAADAESAPRFASVLPAQRPAEAFADLAERLGHAVGVSVRSYGGPGALASVSIRGSSSNQVEVYYDGIPLGRARDGIARLTDTPLAGLARIEVSRGFAPLALASAPLGGAINLIPHDEAVHTYSLLAAGGSWRTAEGHAAAGFGNQSGTWRGTAYGTWLSSAGDFRFFDDNATPYNLADDEMTRRRNNALRTGSGGAVVTRVLGTRAVLTALVDGARRRNGLPGVGPIQSTTAASASDQWLGTVRLRQWIGGDAASGHGVLTEASVFDVAARERFRDIHGELGAGRQDNDDRSATTGARLRAQWRGGAHEIETIGELTADRLRSRDLWPLSVRYPLIRRTTRSVGGEYRWLPFAGRVTLAPSYRLEEAVARSPRLVRVGAALPVRAVGLAPTARTTSPAIAVRIAPAAWCAFKGHTGRYRRLPTFLELFGERGAISGNPALAPESGSHSDAGLTLLTSNARMLHASVELSGFAVRARDLVVYVQNSQRTSIAQNISAARIDGLEATVALAAGEAFRCDANLTLQTARDESTNPYTRQHLLPGRPLREAFVSAAGQLGRVDLRGDIAASSGIYLDRAGRVPVSPCTTLGAGVAYHAGGRGPHSLTLTASVTNITNTRTADLAGFPLPGRAVYISVDRIGMWSNPRTAALSPLPDNVHTSSR